MSRNFSLIDIPYPVRKMHGTGNDFIVLMDPAEMITEKAAARLCRHHFGIGADGLIAVTKSRLDQAAFRMKYFNSDGTPAEICGNGIRCFAKYLADTGLLPVPGKINVDTDAGIIIPEIISNSEKEGTIRVNMGIPVFVNNLLAALQPDKSGIIRGHHLGLDFTFVSMGNPHCIIFHPDPDKTILKMGPLFEKERSIFPQKTNVEFVRIENRQELTVRIWERGAGPTLACGTGACAAMVAAAANARCDHEAVIHLLGGDLLVSWEGNQQPVYMTGPAVNVFDIDPHSIKRYLAV